ncbi:hypothetical protein FPZ43_12955 [Mucilaginibacter pallidiroseus]|uniref:Outer membrane protein beta-barrel domain-containing protein n=1 Tax=Mucilaginibacter pallidiroseus TaxID=2599295 RepID=A0A563U7S4_9SPHI|nr:hypothetical protein [Mucilaginibacter pallidiroseus]TWR27386.1 hypothetical protein FPZ43_12955 [Mucilaginibacter pallidiroseus]
MKKLASITLVLFCFLVVTKRASAQDYKTAVGGKFGAFENGISVKYFMDKGTALEGVLGFRSRGAVFTGLYELHQQAFNVPLLNFYYGAGAHIGAIGKGEFRRFGDDRYYDSSHLLLGADAVLGLEYKFPDAPIAVSLDLNPRLELATGPFFDVAPGLGIKYTF